MDGKLARVALVLALIVTGAIGATIGVKAYRYHFVGQDADGAYHFSSDPQTVYERTSEDANGVQEGVMVVSSEAMVAGPVGSGTDPNRKLTDMEEMMLLRQQDRRRVVHVGDTWVNGHRHRSLIYEYTLSDGRTETMAEGDPGNRKDEASSPAQHEQDFEETARLRKQGLYDVARVIETVVGDQIHRTQVCRYTLADGREVEIGESAPDLKAPTNHLTVEQSNEVWRLQRLGQCERLENTERDLYGKTFIFENDLVTLADGTVVTLSVGEPKVDRRTLSDTNRTELSALRKTNAGEELSPYEDEVRGRLFTFTRTRYVLSDGTEVIKGEGTPKQAEDSNP